MRGPLAPLLIVVVHALPAQGVHLTVQDPCSEAAWLDVDMDGGINRSVGDLTIEALESAGFPHIGSAAGIQSIGGTVTGETALELIGPGELRAYGWCYRINGYEPSVLADAYFVNRESAVIQWLFGFAHYKDGEWLSYCTPTHVTKPAYICGKTRTTGKRAAGPVRGRVD